jgi:hypothetical protein
MDPKSIYVSLVYSRVSNSTKSTRVLDRKAQEYITKQPLEVQLVLDSIYTQNQYEEKLAHLLGEGNPLR